MFGMHPGFDSRAKAAWSDKLHMANASEYHWIFRGSMLPGKSSYAASLELRPGSALRYVVVRNEFLPVSPVRAVPNLSNSR